jgi:hypothetical protein
MTALDWTVLAGYFVLMVLIGIWSRTKIKTVVDYFTTGAALKVVDVASFRFCGLAWIVSSPVAITKQPLVAGPASTAAGAAVVLPVAGLATAVHPDVRRSAPGQPWSSRCRWQLLWWCTSVSACCCPNGAPTSTSWSTR